jgi:hypothetical protein
MNFRTVSAFAFVLVSLTIGVVYIARTEAKHIEYHRQVRAADYSEQVREQCALTWPYKQERYDACVLNALTLRTDI